MNYSTISKEYRGLDEGLPPVTQRTGNFFYGNYLFLLDELSDEKTYYAIADLTKYVTEDFTGDRTLNIFINSSGGSVMLMNTIIGLINMAKLKGIKVYTYVFGIAASAASVIAMAGTKVLMSPMSSLMIHNPMASAFGDTVEMERAISMLSEIKESIINAYQLKTGLSRAKISHMMDEETWMNARKAVELGFADDILYTDSETEHEVTNSYIFSRAKVINSLVNKLSKKEPEKEIKEESKTSIESLYKRLYLLNH